MCTKWSTYAIFAAATTSTESICRAIHVVDAVDDFIDTAIRLKWENPMACLDLDRYDEFQEEIKTIQADYVFEEWDPRQPNTVHRIRQFARTLDIDLDLTPAEEYIKKYQEFHQY